MASGISAGLKVAAVLVILFVLAAGILLLIVGIFLSKAKNAMEDYNTDSNTTLFTSDVFEANKKLRIMCYLGFSIVLAVVILTVIAIIAAAFSGVLAGLLALFETEAEISTVGKDVGKGLESVEGKKKKALKSLEHILTFCIIIEIVLIAGLVGLAYGIYMLNKSRKQVLDLLDPIDITTLPSKAQTDYTNIELYYKRALYTIMVPLIMITLFVLLLGIIGAFCIEQIHKIKHPPKPKPAEPETTSTNVPATASAAATPVTQPAVAVPVSTAIQPSLTQQATNSIASLAGQTVSSAISGTDKCVVLDLDNTLLFSLPHVNLVNMKIINNPAYLKLRNRVYNFELGESGREDTQIMWGVTRPHITEFLLFCLSYFRVVAIWSAGDKVYVDNIINHLFKYINIKPHIIYSLDDTSFYEGTVLKDLTVMMKDPRVKGLMTLENTLTIDDNEHAIRKNVSNAIEIPFYGPKSIEEMQKDDKALLKIIQWLETPEVMESKDVRTLNKQFIFL